MIQLRTPNEVKEEQRKLIVEEARHIKNKMQMERREKAAKKLKKS